MLKGKRFLGDTFVSVPFTYQLRRKHLCHLGQLPPGCLCADPLKAGKGMDEAVMQSQSLRFLDEGVPGCLGGLVVGPLAFGSGRDPGVLGSSPHWAPCMEPASPSASLSLCVS